MKKILTTVFVSGCAAVASQAATIIHDAGHDLMLNVLLDGLQIAVPGFAPRRFGLMILVR